MSLQKTILNDEIIKNILYENYNIIVIKILLIDKGSSNVFKIFAEENTYILKEFGEDKKIDNIEKDIHIADFLSKSDVKVPKYIKTAIGQDYIKYLNKIIILEEFIDGYTIENNTGDYNKVIESASIYGKLLYELNKYPKLSEEDAIEKNFSQEGLKKKIIKLSNLKENIKDNNPYKKQIIEDLDFKIEVATDLYNNFNFNIIRKLTISNTHGDFSVQQLIYKDNNKTAVVDFESAKSMIIVWEVIRSYSYIDKEAKNGELNINTLTDYFKEFFKYFKLNKYDLKYAAQIYLIQLIGSTFGYKEYNSDNSKKGILEFAFFRTNLCKYLYKNQEQISNRLLKEFQN